MPESLLIAFARDRHQQDRAWMREAALHWRRICHPEEKKIWLANAIRWRDAARYWAQNFLTPARH